jgi:hypothetical protein
MMRKSPNLDHSPAVAGGASFTFRSIVEGTCADAEPVHGGCRKSPFRYLPERPESGLCSDSFSWLLLEKLPSINSLERKAMMVQSFVIAEENDSRQ